MNKRLTAIGIALAGAALLLTAAPADVDAQQVGDNFTIIVPAGAITDLKKVIVVTGKPKASATKVGTCRPGDVRLQDAQLVDREGKSAPVTTQLAVIFPGASGISELAPGWRIGSFRPGGKCGPGYEAFVAHLVALS